MRSSGKTIINRNLGNDTYVSSDFVKAEFEGSLRDKGYDVVHEKAYLCPCKSRESDHRNTCKNCGGTGWIFANPTKTKMVVSGIMLDDKMKEGALREWGMMDMGNVKITAYPEDKLTYMDRISVLDATSEINEILYPVLKNDETQKFIYTKYDIVGIDFIGLFQTETAKIKRLIEVTDYEYRDNVITFDAALYNATDDMCVTIRYIHNPVYHVIDIMRESIMSTKDFGVTKMQLPVHALGKRAHLIKDAENFDGDRLLDNSWKPTACEAPDFSKFQRQLRYSTTQFILDNMTSQQKAELILLMQRMNGISSGSSTVSGTL
jgi:hypothetical protein